MAIRFDDLQQNRFQEDLQRAAGYKPLQRSDLEQAYQRYSEVGVKVGRVKKNQSDADLYRMATNDVLSWWKAQKAKETAAAENARRAQQQQEAAQRQAAEQAARAASGGSGTGGRGAGGAGGYDPNMLPDTAMPVPSVNPFYVQNMLKQNGFAGARPPAYALRSQADFDAWLMRAIRQRGMKNGTAVSVIRNGQRQVVPVAQQATNRNPVAK